MQFQIIFWEFNCKSNKNIKSYYMLYENIVSNLLMFLRKCSSSGVRCRPVILQRCAPDTSGRLAVGGTACGVCLHSGVSNIQNSRDHGRVCKNTSLVPRGGGWARVSEGGFWSLLVSKALLVVPSQVRLLLRTSAQASHRSRILSPTLADIHVRLCDMMCQINIRKISQCVYFCPKSVVSHCEK